MIAVDMRSHACRPLQDRQDVSRGVQGGVVLLLVAVCTNVGYNTASKSLSVDIGGGKRLHALSTAMSACLLLPWTLFILLTRQVCIL